MDTDQLMNIWNAHEQHSTWRDVLRIRAANKGDTAIAQRALDALPEVSALEALAANRDLVELLTSRRWYVIRDAREMGASWSQIGEALGISKQGAQDFYQRKVAEQEKYVPDFQTATEPTPPPLLDGPPLSPDPAHGR